MASDVVVRNAKVGDVEAHLRVRNLAAPAHGNTLPSIPLLLRRPDTVLSDVTLIATVDDEVVGTAWFADHSGVAHTVGVAVLPEARRRAVGTALADALVARVPPDVAHASAVVDVRDAASVRFAAARGCVPSEMGNSSVAIELDDRVLDLARDEVRAAPPSLRVEFGEDHLGGGDADDPFWESVAELFGTRPAEDLFGDNSAAALRLEEGERIACAGGFTVALFDGDVAVASATGETIAWTDWMLSQHTTVRPSHQSRGLSRVVKSHQHLRAADMGLRRVVTLISPGRPRMIRTAHRLGYVTGGMDWMVWRRSSTGAT